MRRARGRSPFCEAVGCEPLDKGLDNNAGEKGRQGWGFPLWYAAEPLRKCIPYTRKWLLEDILSLGRAERVLEPLIFAQAEGLTESDLRPPRASTAPRSFCRGQGRQNDRC